MNNSTYPNNPQEAIFMPVQKCPYHVTFDIDLDLEHTLDARWPVVHRVQVWWRSGHLPARSDWSARIIYIIYIVYIVAWQTHRQTDCNTSLPLAGEVIIIIIIIKHPHSANLRQATILTFNHVTIRFSMCHFLLVVHWNRASISNGFQDICIQVCLWHDLDLQMARMARELEDGKVE